MEFINSTRMVAGYNMGLEPSGRELLVVVVKGTFVLPEAGEQVRLADKQWPLVLADTFTGKPGFSAPLHEIDFAPRKQFCDVLLTGHACAPQGHELQRMRVGLRVGSMEKVFEVIGDRVWQAGLSGIAASAPQPFSRMPISYDRAFGGADCFSDDEREHDAFLPNPVGRGWHKHLKNAWVDGTPLPNTEEVGEPVKFPSDTHQAMALGPIGRGWPQRARYAGTYDQAWLDRDFPFLPKDFDERYYQAAPEDQQMPLPQGPMEAVLSGFTPDGLRHFMLPYVELPVQVFPKRGDRASCVARLDTIAFEPDQERFTMTWRMAMPLHASLHELDKTVVGGKGREWWQQREQVSVVEPTPVANQGVA